MRLKILVVSGKNTLYNIKEIEKVSFKIGYVQGYLMSS